MKCRLCREERQPVRSHIIPEFMYERSGLYDKKHRYAVIEKWWDIAKFEQRQKGSRENLLCKGCEVKISRWERYARRIVYGPRKLKKIGVTPDRRVLLFEPVDYKTFKLFLLSLLWRMSVSGLRQFSQVSLGPHEERVRKMIFEEGPGDEDDYGCIITVVVFSVKDGERAARLRRLILDPQCVRADGHTCYRILIGGFLYVFVVSKHNIPAEVRGLFINRSNQLPILIQGIQELPLLAKSLSEFGRDMERFRRERACS